MTASAASGCLCQKGSKQRRVWMADSYVKFTTPAQKGRSAVRPPQPVPSAASRPTPAAPLAVVPAELSPLMQRATEAQRELRLLRSLLEGGPADRRLGDEHPALHPQRLRTERDILAGLVEDDGFEGDELEREAAAARRDYEQELRDLLEQATAAVDAIRDELTPAATSSMVPPHTMPPSPPRLAAAATAHTSASAAASAAAAAARGAPVRPRSPPKSPAAHSAPPTGAWCSTLPDSASKGAAARPGWPPTTPASAAARGLLSSSEQAAPAVAAPIAPLVDDLLGLDLSAGEAASTPLPSPLCAPPFAMAIGAGGSATAAAGTVSSGHGSAPPMTPAALQPTIDIFGAPAPVAGGASSAALSDMDVLFAHLGPPPPTSHGVGVMAVAATPQPAPTPSPMPTPTPPSLAAAGPAAAATSRDGLVTSGTLPGSAPLQAHDTLIDGLSCAAGGATAASSDFASGAGVSGAGVSGAGVSGAGACGVCGACGACGACAPTQSSVGGGALVSSPCISMPSPSTEPPPSAVAELEPQTKLTQLPTAAQAGIRMLQTGCVATKFGRQGKPHSVAFRLSADLSTLGWERQGLGKYTSSKVRLGQAR